MKTHLPKPTSLLLLATVSGLSRSLVPTGELDFCSVALGQSVVEVPTATGVEGISDNGQTVSGVNVVNGVGDYFQWNAQSGFVQAHASGIGQGFVSPISGDGHLFGGADPQAFTVRDNGVRTNIGTGSPNLNSSSIESISRDGTAAAGTSVGGQGSFFAGWRWTAAGGLQFLPGFVTARGISGDGNTVVGTGLSGDTTALVWHNGVTTTLPEAPGSSGFDGVEARATNFNGNIVVGKSRNNAAVWVNGQGTVLPQLSGYALAWATDLSDDGSVIIGQADTGQGNGPAFIWTPTRGTELLSSYFASYGVSLPAGNRIFSATVTPDGRTFGVTTIGLDNRGHGYIVSVPTPAGMTCMLLGLLAAGRRKRS